MKETVTRRTGEFGRSDPFSAVLYGECLESPPYPTDILFTGQRLDGTGLYYYGARYYDAGIGRFISPDTLILDPANPQSFNRYSYCLNNPLKYVDPSGHDVEINGWNVEVIRAMLLFGYYLPMEAQQALSEVVASTYYQDYQEYGKANSGYAEMMENSDYVFSIIKISNSNGNFTLYMDVYTELMDAPIPTVLAAEGSPEADIAGGAWAMSTGNKILFVKWGNVRIRYQMMTPEYLGKLIREECYHFAEQMGEG